MSQTLIKFRYLSPYQRIRNYKDVQNSVNKLFDIIEEYGRLEKKLCVLKNKTRD
jgi:hypothetical protein